MGRRFAPTESPEFYWSTFIDFCRHEVGAGGPDPHMRVIERLTEGLPDEERIWALGCYLSVFNVPTAELLWDHWTRDDVLFGDGVLLEEWLRENWRGLHLRRERRPVKAPHKLREHMVSFAWWADARFPALRETRTYEDAWEILNEIRYVGRYAAIKLGEVIHRCFPEVPAMDDMRSKGGKHPRVGLAYLYPDWAEELNGNDAASNLVLTDLLGGEVQKTLAQNGLNLDCFHVEALLCDYKQSYHGRQYPGRSQDSELDHYRKVREYWGDRFETGMFEARRNLFPGWALGELQGWDGVREPLKTVLKDHGYTWSDELFNYHATTDFAHPVRRL